MKAFYLSLAGAALLCFAVPTFADVPLCQDNLIANCGFEDGVYTSGGNSSVPLGWTSNAGYDSEPSYNNVRTNPVHSGNFALSIGNLDNEPVAGLSQTISTVSGDSYSGSLFVYYGGCCSDPNAFFNVLVNNQTLVSLNSTNTSPSYQQFSFSFTGTGSDVLTLEGNTGPSEWFVDDVAVTGAAGVATPEPNLLVVLAGALSAVVFWRVRKSRQLSR